jgi:kinesin family protein 5
VTDFTNGVSGALILYGQTGSGKTYTMFGPSSPDADAETKGMASRVGAAVLGAAADRRRTGLDVSLNVSYVEVFGNDVSDLLAGAPKASIYTAARTELFAGNFDTLIGGQQDLDEALALGESRKRSASTAMNERSTRAHTLLIFHFLQGVPGSDEPPISSRLFLADLGGSERVGKSLANAHASSAGFVPWEEYYNSRRRIAETNYINQGLLSLKQCIQALGERQRCSAGRPVPVVPFRDSGLTAVLEPALGGLARTTIIVCCSPESASAEETVQSLRFGETCSHIQQVQRNTSDPSSAIKKALQQIDEKVAEVERQIREKERWEWRQTVRKDMVDASEISTWGKSWAHSQGLLESGDMGTIFDDAVVETRTDAPAETLPEVVEVEFTEVEHKVWGQVLVGAEEENKQLEALLEDRRRLLGAD